MQKAIIAVLVMFWSVCMFGSAFAAGEADEAKAMVEKAAALVKAEGRDKALAEIGNPQGQFVKGSLYVFVYDLTGTMVAHPVNPKLVGKNMLEVPDAGKAVPQGNYGACQNQGVRLGGL